MEWEGGAEAAFDVEKSLRPWSVSHGKSGAGFCFSAARRSQILHGGIHAANESCTARHRGRGSHSHSAAGFSGQFEAFHERASAAMS